MKNRLFLGLILLLLLALVGQAQEPVQTTSLVIPFTRETPRQPDGAVAMAAPAGDITAVFAGPGLTGGGTRGNVTLSVASGGITSDMIADGTITPLDLNFDPATQAELDAHKTSTDHDGQYFTQTQLSTPGTINTPTNPVDWTKLKGVPAGFADGVDDVGLTSVTTDASLTGNGTAGSRLSVNTAQIQARVTGSCDVGSSIRLIRPDGSVECELDDNSGGTIAGVTAGTGLTGGGTTGAVSLSIAPPYQLPQTCSNGQVPKSDGAGGWMCANDIDTNSGGTITGVTAGSGLAGGGSFGNVTLSVAPGRITSVMIADGEVGTADLANGAVTADKLAANSVDSSKIVDGTIQFSDWNSNGCTTNQIPKWNGSAWICASDNDTTYTAGSGLVLTGNQFSVNFAGTGADTVARSDHNHDTRYSQLGHTHPVAGGWTDAGTVVHLTDGTDNVGIGTTTPAARLHAVGTTGVIGEARDPLGATVGVRGITASFGGRGVEGFASADSGSTVGVRGDVVSTGGIGVVGFAGAATGTTFGVVGQSNSISGFGVQGVARATTGDTVGVRGRVDSPSGTAGVFENLAGGKILSGGSAFGELFSVDGVGNLSTSGNVIAGRNVGIGTTQPTSRLHVAGSGSIENITIQNTAGGPRGEVSLLLVPAGVGAPWRIHANDDSSLLRIFEGRNPVMAITRGDVGVGTISPEAKLDVKGVIRTSGDHPNFVGHTNVNLVADENNTGQVAFWTRTQGQLTPRMTILNNGNVGIGTTNPRQNLVVVGDIRATDAIISDHVTTGTIMARDIVTNNITTHDITTYGNVGIGTTRPETALNIKGEGDQTGAIRLDNDGVQTQLVSDAHPEHRFGQIGTLSNHPFNIMTNSSSKIFITRRGDVGIGTISPADRLHVRGDVRVGIGTVGCVKDADSTIIAGTCPSDGRLKKDIKPFANILDKLVQLQPVNFHWKVEEFPEYRFGTSESFALVAQEVERILPELVTEDTQGYKSVRYNKLPLLLLQGVKEQQAQIEALRAELKALRGK